MEGEFLGGEGWNGSLWTEGAKGSLWLGRVWRLRWTKVDAGKSRNIFSVPLGSGEAAWLRLHSHLPSLVKLFSPGKTFPAW